MGFNRWQVWSLGPMQVVPCYGIPEQSGRAFAWAMFVAQRQSARCYQEVVRLNLFRSCAFLYSLSFSIAQLCLLTGRSRKYNTTDSTRRCLDAQAIQVKCADGRKLKDWAWGCRFEETNQCRCGWLRKCCRAFSALFYSCHAWLPCFTRTHMTFSWSSQYWF